MFVHTHLAFRLRPVFKVGSGLHFFNFISVTLGGQPFGFRRPSWFLVFQLAHNGLHVGDVALCCACGKAILLTRCYGK